MAALIVLPIIGALIGWVTNYLAVKMLFHPRKPIRFLFVRIHGVFPKRQAALAKKLGEIVSQELFSFGDVKRVLLEKTQSGSVRDLMDSHVDYLLTTKLVELVPMVAMVMSPELKANIKKLILEEVNSVLEKITTELEQNPDASLDIHLVVEEKVSNFSSDKLEQILFGIMRKEFRFIELVGAVLGFFIGVVQVIIAQWSLVVVPK